ncbi:MAG: asparagine synthase (glutamine-hydrolyzing) [Candidatus Marinimicrobia bacterium]|mgnify:CR=1 FL=1|nr:asparagine synthase (glutamine-hydrolyzing) [Candidatus Neomarinimicrobiota bacterium]|tara:strand:- start:4324 stop:6276 length:1953 start_codon:yes stop_codon:yes gene_type:complete
MCGISGFWTVSSDKSINWLESTVLKMADTLVHRGPDDSGTWVDPEVGIAFGHRRLAIIDTSFAGHQPMVSSDGRFVITYNGEVYNFQEIRQELEKNGHRFKGHSDTEVILATFVEWGVEASLKKFNGMFSFAVWDRRDRLLWLSRDRIGEKPLYYGVQNGTFFFGSELKAILMHPHFEPNIDQSALASFLRLSYVPAPFSIYKGIKKLLPGHFINLKSPTERAESHAYWSLNKVMRDGSNNSFTGSERDAADELEVRMKETVKSRMVSDVPLGAFLSGGIDSSTIVALMQSQSNRPVNTFTIGFNEQDFNEAVHAKKVAQYLGTNHTELYVNSPETMNVIPQLPSMYDEPFADSSQIPTHLIAALARQHVSVALTGDGGDELYAGYNRYLIAERLWKVARRIPNIVKYKTADYLSGVSPESVERFYRRIEGVLPNKMKVALPKEKFYKLASALRATSTPRAVYKRVVSIIQSPEKFLKSGRELTTIFDSEVPWQDIDNIVLTMIYLDLMTYHPDDILQKVDRAAMSVSLETRVPFLDHQLMEFIMSLPLQMKIRNGSSKWILRRVLYRYIPEELIERPKMGFTAPVGEWIKGPIKEWAEELIHNKRIEKEPYFNSQVVFEMWKQHLSGKFNHTHQLWNILMFQAWLNKSN